MSTQIIEKRFLNIEETASYLGVGVSHARKVAKIIGAEKKIGQRSVFDKKVLDNYFDNNNAILINKGGM